MRLQGILPVFRLTLFAATLVVSAHARAARIETVSAEGAPARSANVRAHRVDGTALPFESALLVPGVNEISLPDGLWELKLAGPDGWMRPLHLRNHDSATARVWPTVALKVTGKGIRSLRVHFTSNDANGPSGDVDCEVADPWKCWIPPGKYDLRFSAAGVAPEFRFGVAVPAVPQPPLRLSFVAGASLSGRVQPARGARGSMEGVEVTLAAASGDSGAPKQTIRTDGKGFFQFKGLSPGDFTVRAAKGGLVTQGESVKILAAVAAELTAPLILDRPKRLTVTVMPRLDPAGRPWLVRLSSHDRRLRRGDIISESHLAPSGEWTHPRLLPGDYTVEVRTSGGERWTSEEVTIGRDDAVVAVAALPVRIVGTVSLGMRPLPARLSFGGERGVTLRADADGRFEGDIPPMQDDETVILVEAETPRVKRTIKQQLTRRPSGDYHADIRLESTTLTGRVLNTDRSPEPRAWITASRSDPFVFEQIPAEVDGSFQIAGFEPGTYQVTADAHRRRSRRVDVELAADEPREIELVLEAEERIQGRLTAGGVPAIAGEIYAFPRDAWGPTLPHAVSNEAGMFELMLPPQTTTFDFLALHPAFDVVFARTAIVEGKDLNIRMTQFGGRLVIDSKIKPEDLVLVRNAAQMSVGWLALKSGGTLAPNQITIARLVPSKYFVCTRDLKKCASGELAPHGNLTLSLAE